MAIYKPEDITASMMRENFPQVVADLQDEPEITAESLRDSHPDIVAVFTQEGRDAASTDTQAAVQAEQERVVAIQALSRPGAESIIKEALADTTMSVDAVKVKLFDHDATVRTSTAEQHQKDGESLAGELQKIGAQASSDEDESEKEASHKRMLAKAKGEK